jgi:DNA-binding NtrC family response regulator
MARSLLFAISGTLFMSPLKLKKRILIVDDEILCDLVARVIESPDRMFYSATSIKKARSILEMQKVDLILLDPNIQNGNGLALLDDLKQKCSSFLGQPRTIVMSATAANADNHSKEEVFFLSKPFQISQLRVLVQKLLKQTEVE